MAKDKERKIARTLYVDQHKTAKQICQIISVTEKTIGDWINRYGWKETKLSRVNTSEQLERDFKELIQTLTEKRAFAAAKITP